MKLAILLIALIGLSISQTPTPTPTPTPAPAAWVSPTTTLALSYKTKTATQKQTAADNLAAANTALGLAQTARTNAEVGVAPWNDWKAANTLVTTNAGLLKTQDTALAGLVATAATKAAALATATVNNDCQTMQAAMRVNWNALSANTATQSSALDTLLTNYVVPTTTTLATQISALTTKATAFQTAITDGKVQATTIPANIAVSGDLTKALNWNAWGAVGDTGSYKAMKCPNEESFICKDCTGTSGTISPYTTANTLIVTDCTWEKMNQFYFLMSQMMTKLQALEDAKGRYYVYKTVLANLAEVTAAQTAYANKFSDVTDTMTALQAQVDKMAVVLLQMQQMSALVQKNLVLQKKVTAQAVVAAGAAKTTADAAVVSATNALTALQSKDTAATGAVADQVTVVNTTMTTVMNDMTALSTACATTQKDNAALQAAVMAQGVAHELTTSSVATDALAVAWVKSLNDQTKVSKTDYDNVVKMKAASGSSTVKFGLFSLIALIFAYYHK